MQFLIMLLMGLLTGSAVAYEMDSVPDQSFVVHPCDRYTRYFTECLRVHEARDRAQAESLRIVRVVDTRGRATLVREFVLIAYDFEGEGWHTIRLTMPLVGNSTFQPAVLTPGYEVRRIKGQSFNKMFFQVTWAGRELRTYGAKHLSLPEDFRIKHPDAMTLEATEVIYLSTPPHLVNPEFVQAGQEFVVRKTEEVLAELKAEGVLSRAYPGHLVSDIVHPWVPLHLVLAEQVDPCLLKSRSRVCQRLIPENPFRSDDEVMQAVLTEFVVNGEDAFRYLVSSGKARGALQFTNTYRGTAPGTYDIVRRAYPQAVLDPDFRSGTEDFRNSLKMAILLIDMELAYGSTPAWVRQAFLEDYRLGLLCPAAAYNGGAQQCRKFGTLVAEYRRARSLREVTFHTLTDGHFLSWVARSPWAFNPETHGYLEKILQVFGSGLLRETK